MICCKNVVDVAPLIFIRLFPSFALLKLRGVEVFINHIEVQFKKMNSIGNLVTLLTLFLKYLLEESLDTE